MSKRQPQRRQWDGAEGDTVRVLLECPPDASPSIVSDTVERHGFEVRVCEGPTPGHPCDLLHDGTCNLVSGADVVVNMLREPSSTGRPVLGAVTSERRPPAVVAEMTRPGLDATDPDDRRRLEDRHVTVVESPMTSADLVGAIDEALERRERQVPWWGDGAP